MEFAGRTLVRRWRNTLPADGSLSEDELRRHPAETLQFALTKARQETWTDPETRLVEGWRKRGILGITHGYFHNTMYRGWTAKKV